MTLKRKLLALVNSLFLATSVFAAPSISGPHVTMQTDGTLSDGQANIITNNAGPIQFFTNKTLCGYFDGSTCALTGVSLGTVTLVSPTISGNITLSSAAAKIIPGATSLTFRNNADSASNLTIADAGGITVRNNIVASAIATGSLGSLAIPWVNLFSGSVAIDSDVTAVSNTSPGLITAKNTSSDSDTLDVIAFGANSVGSNLNAFKTRATTTDANTIVNSGDTIFQLTGLAADGASYRRAAAIVMTVDGTPGSADMPGAIDLQTTPDGSATLASVLKLSNDKSANFTGNVIISSATNATLRTASVDGADNVTLILSSTSCASGDCTARGGNVQAVGNEVATIGGSVLAQLGGATGNFRVIGENGGINIFDVEDSDNSATFAGKIFSTATSDIGWTVQSAANQACNTTCTSACIVGQETTSKAFLACTDATADVCLCAGAS